MSELHEFKVVGHTYLRVVKTVMAESQADAKRKAKGSNKGWTVDEPPRGATVDILSVLPPEGLNAEALRRVGIDIDEHPTRKPIFMIDTEGKTAEELAEETFEAVQAHWRATSQLPPTQQDTRRE